MSPRRNGLAHIIVPTSETTWPPRKWRRLGAGLVASRIGAPRAWGSALLVFIATFSAFRASPVVQMADSRYTLLLAETLLRTHSIALDQHFQLPLDPQRHPNVESGRLPYQVEVVKGHVYGLYPPGGAFLSVPIMAALEAFGLSASDRDGRYDPGREEQAQLVVASLLMAFAAVLFLLTAQCLLSTGWSALIALGAAFGTQVWSTGSRALWSDCWGIVLLAAVVLVLARAETREANLHPVLLATLSAWTFFVRPTYAIPIAVITTHVAVRHRRRVAPFLRVGLAWLLLFLAFSWSYCGRLLPLYYTSRTFTLGSFRPALAGVLLSPSRGLLVCVPIVLFIGYLAGRYARERRLRGLAIVALTSIAGHLFLLACFPLWWGGHCYGARYTAGLVPWLVLLAILGLRGRLDLARQGTRLRGRARCEAAAAILLLVPSVAIQARGALCRETTAWNYSPDNVDRRQERLWDWRHPQALAGLVPPPWRVGEPITPGAEAADAFLRGGWSGREEGFRWTDGPEAGLWFDLDHAEATILRMELHGYVPPGRPTGQRVGVEINGRSTGMVTIADGTWRVASVPFAVGLLGRRNRLRVVLPDAEIPAHTGSGRDSRRLGVAVRWLRLDRFEGAAPGIPIELGRPEAAAYLGDGWSGPETSFRWTDGPRAAVLFAPVARRPATLWLKMRPYLAPPRLIAQRVTVRLNGRRLAGLRLDSPAPSVHPFPLAQGALAETNTLELELPDAHAPASLGASDDPRALGVAVEWLRLDDAEASAGPR